MNTQTQKQAQTQKTKRKRSVTKSLTRYVVFSILMLIIYTSISFYFLWLEKPLDPDLTSGFFGFFGGEIVICGLIKLFKLKGEKNERETI